MAAASGAAPSAVEAIAAGQRSVRQLGRRNRQISPSGSRAPRECAGFALMKQQPADRPRRADVADSYDRGVGAYETLWSPVILAPAAALVDSL